MNILVSGDDKEKLSEYIRTAKKKYNAQNITLFDGSFNLADILNSSQSLALFGGDALLIVKPKNVSQIEFTEPFLKDLHTKKEVSVIFDLAAINANTSAYKLIKKNSENKNFSQARDYTLFNICDAIFIDKNAVKVINMVRALDDIETQFFSLLGMIHLSLKNFLSVKYKNKIADAIHPFMKSKIYKYKIDESTAIEMYSKLIEMDVISKSRKHDKRALLEDFMLYFL